MIRSEARLAAQPRTQRAASLRQPRQHPRRRQVQPITPAAPSKLASGKRYLAAACPAARLSLAARSQQPLHLFKDEARPFHLLLNLAKLARNILLGWLRHGGSHAKPGIRCRQSDDIQRLAQIMQRLPDLSQKLFVNVLSSHFSTLIGRHTSPAITGRPLPFWRYCAARSSVLCAGLAIVRMT